MRQVVSLLAVLVLGLPGWGAEQGTGDPDPLGRQLGTVPTAVIAPRSELAQQAGRMLHDDMRARRRLATSRDTAAWRAIRTREGWERYRAPRLAALRASLGDMPAAPRDLGQRVTGQIRGQGYRIDNIVLWSRPGLPVTANLYRPDHAAEAMPGVLICHSHHAPKTQGELQDMGITWARQGCLVLIMDQLGHGERRQHPFRDSGSYPGAFRVSRQDYYFRYNAGIQLHLVGESLIGWMVGDLMRGVDLLLAQPGIDPTRIILLGSVAGGGDPAAVTAALDERIAAVVPFNFGRGHPETVQPPPADPEQAHNFAGSGSWESTRNLRLSVRDGFPPWLLVGAVAPRRLIYAHEFAWDRGRDPVWKRLQRLQELYGVDHLDSVHGRGEVTLRPPEATHCTNIGSVHRRGIHVAFQRWFKIAVPEKDVYPHHSVGELTCLTPEALREITPQPLHRLAAGLAGERMEAARQGRRALRAPAARADLQRRWARLLGDIEPGGQVRVLKREVEALAQGAIERVLLETEPGILIPLVLLLPSREMKGTPVVVLVAQEGKQAMLEHHAGGIARLLAAGVAVCLPDVRGVGETSLGSERGRRSPATGLSSSELMLGQTLLGSRLRDLRGVMAHLRRHRQVDPSRLVLWGASRAPANTPGRRLDVPLDAERLPDGSEPLGGLLALLGALYEEVAGVVVSRGLVSYRSVLDSPFLYLPHDVVVPGALTTGDLVDIAASLAPLPLRLEGLIDGANRRVSEQDATREYQLAGKAYRAVGMAARLSLAYREDAPAWLIRLLERGRQ